MLWSTSIRALLPALLVRTATSAVVKRDWFRAAIEKDFPDPSITQAGDHLYYAYGTAGNGVQVQVAKSEDGLSWEYLDGVDALQPGSVAWSPSDPSVWATDVTQLGDGSYIMYFSAVATNSDDGSKHCIGVAKSTSPAGPFEPVSDDPWVCDYDTGDIDPDQFLDEDGTRWVVYKVDGNAAGWDTTPIMLQQVDEDGYTKIGDPIKILDRDEVDGPLVEAPSLFKYDGLYFLTFSSNWYNTEQYDTSYATSLSVTGPFSKVQAPDAPILVTDNTDKHIWGPGGADVYIIPGTSINVMLFHGWSEDRTQRYMYATTLDLSGGKLKVNWG